MTDDLTAFLDAAEALAVKHALGPTWDEVTEESVDTGEHCGRCGGVWPCDAARLRPLVGMVRAVLALCDSYERSGYPDALIPKGQTIAEFRAVLDTAIPPTPTAEETR
jgi:hypothetical protein